jgi:hypothetical protein
MAVIGRNVRLIVTLVRRTMSSATGEFHSLLTRKKLI